MALTPAEKDIGNTKKIRIGEKINTFNVDTSAMGLHVSDNGHNISGVPTYNGQTYLELVGFPQTAALVVLGVNLVNSSPKRVKITYYVNNITLSTAAVDIHALYTEDL